MLDTVDDHSFFITENNIAVLAHNLNDQGFAAQISKFIQVLDLEADDPFQGRLRNAYDAAICNSFLRSIQKFGAVIGLGLLSLDR